MYTHKKQNTSYDFFSLILLLNKYKYNKINKDGPNYVLTKIKRMQLWLSLCVFQCKLEDIMYSEVQILGWFKKKKTCIAKVHLANANPWYLTTWKSSLKKMCRETNLYKLTK